MSNSSQQDNYSITLNDDILDIASLDTITLTGSGSSGTSDTIVIDLSTIGAGNSTIGYAGSYTTTGISNVSIGPLTTADISFTNNWITPEEWKDGFPDWDRIQKMCEQYPGLKLAFEKFKTTYKLVKDDYDTPKDKRTKP